LCPPTWVLTTPGGFTPRATTAPCSARTAPCGSGAITPTASSPARWTPL